MSDLRQGPLGTPMAQRIALGWIISGPTGLDPCRANVAQVSHCIQHLPHLKDEEQLVPSRLESFVCFPTMRSEHPIKVKKLRDTKTTARTALANRGSPGEPSRGLSDTTRTSDADCIKTRVESRPSIDSVSVTTCINCAGSHNLATCEDFLSKSIAQRNALVKNKQVCFKCLRPGHFTSTCLSRSQCIHCNRNHSLMHRTVVTAETPVDRELKVDDLSRMVSHASSAGVTNVKNAQAEVTPVGVLLATASVDPHLSEGQCFQVRALLDQGSTLSFISESRSQTPRTKRQSADLQIGCFGDSYVGLARSKVSFRLGPCAQSGLEFTTYVFRGNMTYAISLIRFPHSWLQLP